MEPEINRNNAALAWIVAALFAIVALVLFFMLTGDNSGDLSDVRERILTDCAATDDESRDSCALALGELEEILTEVREDLGTVETQEAAPSTE